MGDKTILKEDIKRLGREKFYSNFTKINLCVCQSPAPTTEHALYGFNLKIANALKDLDVWIYKNLDLDKHTVPNVETANGIFALTKKCFCNIRVEIIRSIYKLPNQVWYQHKKKHVNLIKNVQRRAALLW